MLVIWTISTGVEAQGVRTPSRQPQAVTQRKRANDDNVPLVWENPVDFPGGNCWICLAELVDFLMFMWCLWVTLVAGESLEKEVSRGESRRYIWIFWWFLSKPHLIPGSLATGWSFLTIRNTASYIMLRKIGCSPPHLDTELISLIRESECPI